MYSRRSFGESSNACSFSRRSIRPDDVHQNYRGIAVKVEPVREEPMREEPMRDEPMREESRGEETEEEETTRESNCKRPRRTKIGDMSTEDLFKSLQESQARTESSPVVSHESEARLQAAFQTDFTSATIEHLNSTVTLIDDEILKHKNFLREMRSRKQSFKALIDKIKYSGLTNKERKEMRKQDRLKEREERLRAKANSN